MPNRREFLSQTAAAGAALALATTAAGAERRPTDTRRSLRLLILGGTGNIGPWHVRAAVARGHEVAVFSRGKTQADLPATVERLLGDRNGNLDAIRNRTWDAVVDIATFGPAWVRSLGEALRGRVEHYTFISTVSVYHDPSANDLTTENSPVLEYTGSADPYSVITHVGADYGALKVLCEREAEKQFPGRTLVLRPGYIGGPGETNLALSYWPVRAQRGGEMLAGDNPSTPVQFIDVRDMAAWAVRLIEERATGVYNAVGPAAPTNLRQIVNAACEVVPSPPKVTWVPTSWLLAQEHQELWGMLLFWSRGVGPIMRMSNERALAKGLTTRPVRATLADTLDWYERQPAEARETLTTGHRRKADGSGWMPVTSTWSDYLEREQQVLSAWHAQQSARE